MIKKIQRVKNGTIIANNFYPGTLHWLCVTYEESPDIAKYRPVLIFDVEDDKIYYYSVTRQEGRIHQRKFRPRLEDWKSPGLKYPSYVKVKNPPDIAKVNDFSSGSFIGEITEDDINKVSLYINRLGY